jgi:hypothetical protein
MHVFARPAPSRWAGWAGHNSFLPFE